MWHIVETRKTSTIEWTYFFKENPFSNSIKKNSKRKIVFSLNFNPSMWTIVESRKMSAFQRYYFQRKFHGKPWKLYAKQSVYDISLKRKNEIYRWKFNFHFRKMDFTTRRNPHVWRVVGIRKVELSSTAALGDSLYIMPQKTYMHRTSQSSK